MSTEKTTEVPLLSVKATEKSTARTTDAKSTHDALRLAAIRLGILADRMEGCNADAVEDGRLPVHELLSEARMFETEARQAAGMEER